MSGGTDKHDRIRSAVQFAFFGFFLAISVNSVLFDLGKSSIPPVSLLGICPVGGITALYILITTGTVISFATVAVLGLSLIFGPVFCGWVCPLGTFQDFVSKITTGLHTKKYNTFIPDNLDKRLRLMRYAVLALIVLLSALRILHRLREYCIYYSVIGLWTGFAAVGGLLIPVLIAAVTSVFTERPWCKYLCPYGALLGLTNRISLFSIRRKPSGCTGCKLCDNKCPMNIDVSEKSIVRDSQCISCMRCISQSACPVKDTVAMSSGGTKNGIVVRRKSLVLAIAIVFTLSVSVVCFQDVKLWATNSLAGEEASLSGNEAAALHTIQPGVKYNDGEYEGLAVGYRPGLKVLVSVENDMIIDIEVVSHRETRGYYEESFDLIPRLIIENQSTRVDSISGATETVDGIKKAVENALKKALQ